MTTTATLTRLIVANEHHTTIQLALLDSLYAVRRSTWQATPYGCRRDYTCDYHQRKDLES